jgi:hypothetical protein
VLPVPCLGGVQPIAPARNSTGRQDEKRQQSGDNQPPTTTVARARCTSVPTPVANAAGSIPTVATVAVMSTGRKRSTAPDRTASRSAQSLLSHPVDVGDHDDAVLHGHAEQGNEADSTGDI